MLSVSLNKTFPSFIISVTDTGFSFIAQGGIQFNVVPDKLSVGKLNLPILCGKTFCWLS